MNFIYIMFILLQWSWGIIQNIIGLLIFLVNIKCKHYYYKGTIVTVWKKQEYCMGIGMFIFMSGQCPEDPKQRLSADESFEKTKVHEYGHIIQSIILGPLFLPVIGLPSCMWANYLGEYVTKCKSMGQAMIEF